MAHEPAAFLGPWQNFYVITGSSAAALTGLMFVVLTLVQQAGSRRRSPEGTATFSTPTVVHFAAALLVSALLCAPWRSLVHIAVLLALGGLCGLGNAILVAYRMTRMEAYTSDAEDWVWHTILPLLAYGAIVAGAFALPSYPVEAPFAVASAVVVLLGSGIHNAWDVVTFVALADPETEDPGSEKTAT